MIFEKAETSASLFLCVPTGVRCIFELIKKLLILREIYGIIVENVSEAVQRLRAIY